MISHLKMMIISDTERRILLKLWSIGINYDDEISLHHLYGLTSKNYIWMTINRLEKEGILGTTKDGRKKYAFFTEKGARLTRLLREIEKIK